MGLWSGYIDLACKRALAFEITEYSKVKNICKTGSYNLTINALSEDNAEALNATSHH